MAPHRNYAFMSFLPWATPLFQPILWEVFCNRVNKWDGCVFFHCFLGNNWRVGMDWLPLTNPPQCPYEPAYLLCLGYAIQHAMRSLG